MDRADDGAPADEAAQAEVVRFLRGSPALRGAHGDLDEVETHAARIFLTGDRAFKMKRAVRFSFLDFTTLDRRRAALEAELALNRRTAPMLYRRLVPVTRTAGGTLAIDGEGDAVEWLLEMDRFPDDARLDRVAEAGSLSDPLVDALARAVARLHAEAEVVRDRGGAAPMAAVVRGNGEDLGRLVPDVLPREAVERLQAATGEALERHRRLLDERAADGFVRHCHGDLHLANIVLIDGRPVLFDCLEFDPALAITDVLYDLAFLMMDLLHRDQPRAAERLQSLYLERTEDDRGAALLPFFLAVRATIRCKIAGFETLEHPGPRHSEALAHLRQALRFLEDRPAPRLIAIGGLSGTGKSTLARHLAPRLGPAPGAVVVRSDGIRKRMFGRRPEERLPEEAYAADVSAKVFRRLAERARALLATGRSVIADAVFLRPEERRLVREAAEGTGAAFTGLWLEAPEEVMVRRTDERTGDASDATAAVVRRQLTADPGALDWSTIAAAGDSARVLEEAERIIRRE